LLKKKMGRVEMKRNDENDSIDAKTTEKIHREFWPRPFTLNLFAAVIYTSSHIAAFV
jgi:hypothetical protein